MTGFYPYAIVALLMIHPLTTDAKSKCNSDKTVIKNHLLAEKERPNFFSRDIRDEVHRLCRRDKEELCDEVARHLIGDELLALSGKGKLEEPEIAKKFPAFQIREVTIEDVEMTKLMYWCEPVEYKKEKKGSGSMKNFPSRYDVGQLEGFFCAGSPTHDDRVYVFRPEDVKAEKVQIVIELYDWLLRGISSSSSSAESG